VTILCYHTVDRGWRSPLSIEPEVFADHCAWLAANRKVIDVSEAIGRLNPLARLPRGQVVITFDDGFSGLYEHALPLLECHGLPAIVFLVAETLTPGGRPLDWTSTRPEQARTLSRDEILVMQEAGMTFGSHSYSHRDLTTLSGQQCERDLRASRDLLEDVVGRPVRFLAYPFGHHDAKVRAAAERAGFSHAFGLPEGREPTGRFAVPRVVVVPGNGITSLRLKTSSWYLRGRANPVFPTLRRVARRTGLGLRVEQQ
jgi:peptidoglycan/xylan/chitin deacetylase (PgdA/CDA1 family)